MGKTKVQEIVNNIIYVEPNYLNSTSEFGENGLNTYEFAPPLEDYSIYVNLEVEVRGREVQSTKSSGNNKLIMSYYSDSNGGSTVNFMQGSKIPLGNEGATINSLTTNYTDIFIGDLKQKEPSTEMFGIKSIDIAYNSYMVPEVTIEFIDVRGVSLFAPKEANETCRNIDKAIDSSNQADIANTFFQCFFTFPYPKFTLLVKGFYGQPVSYELTCADFRARFESSTGNFACTAKFVGFHFSFLNDVMLNGILAAPYSDYIGAKYWEERRFTLKGLNGGQVAIPKIGHLIKQMKEIETTAEKIAQSDPVAQEKIALEDNSQAISEVNIAYKNFTDSILQKIPEKELQTGENIFFRLNTNQGFLKAFILLCGSDKEKTEFEGFGKDEGENIKDMFENLQEAIQKYNEAFPDKKLEEPRKFYNSTPTKRIEEDANDNLRALVSENLNEDMKNFHHETLFNEMASVVHSYNKAGVRNKYLDYAYAYYYYDNGFSDALEKYKEENSKHEKDVNDRMEKLKDDSITKALGFIPTVENMTKIVMAHFETFAYMILKTAQTISNENPPRTLSSLHVSDKNDLSDVNDPDAKVPPFPKVTKEINRENSTIREEAWVGDYKGDFREKDLVHGIINGIKEISKDVTNYKGESVGASGESGSEGKTHAIMKYPLCPIDLSASYKPYMTGGFDSNDPSSILGLVGLRAVQILGTTNFSAWAENAKALGVAEAYNFLDSHNLSKEILQKFNDISPNDVIEMMKGNESETIKKPGDGSKPWPWRLDAGNNGGIIDDNGSLIICRTMGNYFSVPYQNLSWNKIISDIIRSSQGEKAARSNDYINTYHNIAKENLFSYDTNINRFSDIVKDQLTEIDGIGYYREKFLEECEYNSSKYKKYLTSDADEVIAYIIEDACKIVPTDGSCMLPTQKEAFANKSFEHGYNMNYFHEEEPGGGSSGQIWKSGWIDKDGKEVKRKGGNGYARYLEEMNSREFTFTEFPGVDTKLNILKSQALTSYVVDTSIFAQLLYYKQKDVEHKALLFLASLGYAIDYNKIVDDFICKKENTIDIIPLPAVMFMGALLWANQDKNKANAVKIDITNCKYAGSITKLQGLSVDIQKRFISIFKNWISNGVKGNTLLRSFNSMREGLELHFLNRTPEDFFEKIGELEDEGFFGQSNTGWLDKFNDKERNYQSIMDLLRNELDDNFFKNYITIDEDRGGDLSDYTRGLRLGNRDGGPCNVHATNFALASCVFVKNSSFFNDKDANSVTVNPTTLANFFDGFLEVISQQPQYEEEEDNTQVSQADKPNDTTTDIKIGIYRYCKMLYDKWIAGLTIEEFNKNWTMEAFFTNSDKYFYFIDAYYNESDFIPINIMAFLDLVVSSYRNAQFSLLSFLSSVYDANKFNFLCVQNFLDLGKRENMERMFDTIPYTEAWDIKRHPNFIVMYPYEASVYLDDINDSEYKNDGFMINMPPSATNRWPEPLTSLKEKQYTIPAFGVSYGKMYQSYFKDIDVSMDNPIVTEQSIKAQFAIACQTNEAEQTGDRATEYTYGQDLYSIYSNNSYTCNVTMMGCAWVQPLMYFVLNNVPLFRGTYLIEKTSHHIEPGNMTTKFTGVRMSNVCTRIARQLSARERLEQTGDGETNGNAEEIRNSFADVDNNCPYKEYPLTDTGSIGIDNLPSLQLASNEWENAKLTVAAFVSMGYTDVAGAAVAGNIMQETHYVPKYVNKMLKANHNPGMKGGLCQWQLDRLTHLIKWDLNATGYIMSEQPMPPFGKQLMFIDKECKGVSAYKATLNALRGATSDDKLESATETFRSNYEGGSEKEKRISFAKKILKEYRNNPPFRDTYEIEKNQDEHISKLATMFVNSLNKTASSSNSDVSVGAVSERSSGDTLYITGRGKDFSNVFDMILSAYSNKVDSVKWVVNGTGDNAPFNAAPAAYIVHVKEGSDLSDISVVDINGNPFGNCVPISQSGETSGMHDSFCKALRKKYEGRVDQLKADTHNSLCDEGYERLLGNDTYKPKNCDDVCKDGGYDVGSSSSENPSDIISDTDNIMIDGWDVGKACQHLISHSKASTQHACAAFVENAIAAGGGPLKTRMTTSENGAGTVHATNLRYYGILEKHGFVMINSGTAPAYGDSPISLQSGDVAIIGKNAKLEGGKFHAVMYCSKGWISDFKQNHMSPYGSSQPYAIYRFRNMKGTPKT